MENKKNEKWIEYLRLCWQGKWIILPCFILGMSYGIYQLVTTPRFYETEMTLLISDPKGNALTIAGVPGFLQSSSDAGLEGIILAILKSRRMGEMIAERFEFEKRYGISRSSAINKAMGMVYAGVPRRFVFLKVSAEEKQLALDIANFCIEALQRFNDELSISSSKFWVTVLDRPELSIHLSNRNQQKRNLIINSLTGLVIGMAIAFTKGSFWKLIREVFNPARD